MVSTDRLGEVSDMETSTLQTILPAGGQVHAPRGKHLLLTLAGCHLGLLDELQGLESLVRHAALATGSTVLSIQSHRFQPHGVTVLALLAESHLSLHSYPETGAVFVDCFTCGDCDPCRCIPVLVEALRPLEIREDLIEREA
jgi:S-adenosylmethionine decarboxylase